jgi:hypothetical protein
MKASRLTGDKQQYLEALEEVVLDPVHILGRIEDLDAECQTNMWTLSLDNRLAQEVTTDDLNSVVQRVIRNREDQVRQMGLRSIFYLWFDDRIPALCFNIISATNTDLPFKAPLQFLKSPQSIVESFLASPVHDGIPIPDELILVADDESVEIDTEQTVVPVYAVTLPRSHGSATTK